MSDFQVPRGSTAKLDRIEGELKVGKGARIEAKNGNLVFVSEGVIFDGAAEVACNLECDSLRIGHGGVLRIDGDLVVHKLLDVDHSIKAGGMIKAQDIDVGGRLNAKSLVCSKMRVGGTIEVTDSLEVQTLDVGGKVEAYGTVKIGDFSVGGEAKIGGGVISGNIRVGGKFEAHSQLQFGDLQVLGRTELAANSKGSKISSFGKLSVIGDIVCDEISIAGASEIHGNCKSKKISINGSLEISGSLEITEILEVNGSVEVVRDFLGENIRIGGRFRAGKAIVKNDVQVYGIVETSHGLKGKNIHVNSGSRVEGILIGGRVEIGKSAFAIADWEKKWMGQTAAFRLIGKQTRVGDVYADLVHIGNYSRCGRVFAKVVELEDGCVVDEISYTDELKGVLERSHITRFVTKVTSLPNPPI